MTKEEFSNLSEVDKIDYINMRLKEGITIKDIRAGVGISEGASQKLMRDNNYKYNQKLKQYIPTTKATTQTTTEPNNIVVVDSNTKPLLTKENENILNYLGDNFDILKEFIEKYKTTTQSTTESTTNSIVINLVDDKHLNPKPKSLRINEFIWKDWQEFCDQNKYYSKQDLISMALKEYIQKYK